MSYLYVVELGGGRIKVGQTVNPQTRIATHRAAARAHGLVPGREWVSPPGKGRHEQSLKEFCERRATECHGEYFAGVSFDDAATYAERLPDKTAALEAVAKLGRARAVVAQLAPPPRGGQAASPPPPDLRGRVADLRTRLAAHAAPAAAGGIGRKAVSTAEAAEWLDIPESALEDAITSGQLPVLRVGRQVLRIPVAALDQFLVHLLPEERAS